MNDKTLTDGTPVTADHAEINPATGQQKGYVVLSAEERAKGYVRPVRHSYVHQFMKDGSKVPAVITPADAARMGGCGAVTRMGQSIAETYARDPSFYSGTFCVGCRTHLPLGEFTWDGTDEVVGS